MFWRTLVVVTDVAAIAARFEALKTVLDERSRRLLAAAESQAIGKGGISIVARATGISRSVIRQGLADLKEPTSLAPGRVRKEGGGRKRILDKDASLKTDLESLLESTTRGDPQAALRWTCKSVRQLSEELKRMKHQVSHQVVADLLHELGYSLQANRKTKEGSKHPDRNAQFEHLNGKVKWSLARHQPVISVDTKKKELVGDFKNGGRELRPKGQPELVRVHDFADKELGRATPYGVYDLGRNSGWVSVGMDHDTAEFAVETIRRWWRTMGRPAYPEATRLLITADAGGSNGSRLRLWKVELQKLADETGLRIVVCHFPPGTSKWNKIEHRLFSYITQNWRGKPLRSFQTIVNLIAATTTKTGLTVHAELNTETYQSGIKVSDADLAQVKIRRDKFHGDWNYEIQPRKPPH
ncbi:MAG: ISAzo13 family transposase [Bryobacterales bacterium]|nr:ISAzo13 family transposase [Bryobacterales bacterium]